MLTDVHEIIATRSIGTARWPFYLPLPMWLSVRDELEQHLGYPPLSVESNYMNYLVAGVEVRCAQ